MIKLFSAGIILALLTGCASVSNQNNAAAKKLTAGWTPVKFTYEVQHPYNLKLSERYHYNPVTDTHDFWVYFSDKPHAPPPNRTEARTEMRLQSYRTGEHMFDADVKIVPGTFACIAQVFDAAHGPALMLIAHPDGTVTAGRTTIATNAIGHWWNLKITNDPSPDGKIKVYVNNIPAGTFNSRGPREYYFKCGVYSRRDSDHSEVFYRHIREWANGADSKKST